MAEKMSLEMALSVIDRSIRLLAASGFEDHAKELLEARLPVSAAFAQPAQTVDVNKVRKVIADIEGSVLSDEFTAPNQWADKLTRAIGNAQTLADAVDPLVIRLHDVTAKLEAANALLRECVHFIDYGGAADDDLAEKIEAHLSENEHE